MELWYPEGIKVIPSNYTGNLLTYWKKIVLHTVEGFTYFPNRNNYYGHQLWPTATLAIDNETGEWTVWNHLPLNRSGAAMRNLQGGVQTNNDGCIQIEICWRASQASELPIEALDVLKKWMLWVCAQTGIPYNFVDDFHYYPPENSHRLGKEPWRLRGGEWTNFRGIIGHQHADENVHGDPGKLDINYLKEILPELGEKMNQNLILTVVHESNREAKVFIPADFSRVVEIPIGPNETSVTHIPNTVEVRGVKFTKQFLDRFNDSSYRLPPV